ncbi:hypothetical protein SK128_027887 [Halocaridina rubra]|uniref:UmuC domain-containing protein n=1 Tax=Halocaridina rubra TaxID=373956 RepID=A0AAN8WS16_HALRR
MDANFDHLDGEWNLLPDQHKRTIIHIDIDCFYAQVEMVRNPELRDKPVGVKQKDLMVTCNYKARSLGVKKSMWVRDALKFLPSLILIDGSDLSPYRQYSADITNLALSFTPLVERLGLDENFLDITNQVHDYSAANHKDLVGHFYGDRERNPMPSFDPCACGCFKRMVIGSHIASKLRKKIFESTGITCCAGVGHNKLLAKLVSGYHKPNEQTAIFPWQVYDLLNSLESVRMIPGIGSATSKILGDLGVTSVKDLQLVDINMLRTKFDEETCKKLKDMSFGIDEAVVRPNSRPQSLGVEDAVKRISTMNEVKVKYEELLERLLKLVAEDGRKPGTLKISARKRYGHRETKQLPLLLSVFSKGVNIINDSVKSALMDIILSTFHKIIETSKPFELTLLGIAFTKFTDYSSETTSISRFFQKRSRVADENMETALDKSQKNSSANKFLPAVKKPRHDLSFDSERCLENNLIPVESACSDVFLETDKCEENNFIQVESTFNNTLSPGASNLEKLNSVIDKEMTYREPSGSASALDFQGNGKNNCTYSRLTEDSEIMPDLPNDVDSDVFNSLPKVIQEELLLSFKTTSTRTLNSTSNRNIATNQKTILECSAKVRSCVESFENQIRHDQNVKTTEKLPKHLRNKSHGLDESQPSCSYSVDSSEMNNITDHLTSCSSSSSDKHTRSRGNIILPKDVDADVFYALPEELQNEILKESKTYQPIISPQKNQKSCNNKKGIQSSPLLKYLKKL